MTKADFEQIQAECKEAKKAMTAYRKQHGHNFRPRMAALPFAVRNACLILGAWSREHERGLA